MTQQSEMNGLKPLLGGVDEMMSRHHENIDYFNEAFKTVIDGAYAMANRQREAMAEANRRYAVLMWRAPSPGNWDEHAPLALDLVKSTVETALAQINTVTEVLTQIQAAAIALMEKSAKAGIADFNRAAANAGAERPN